ncbi:MAG: NAD(P)H-binding protein [Sphingomonadales bacterium]
MKVILFGASGMVGQGVLRECLADPGVTEVVAVVRSPLGADSPKLRQVAHRDFTDFSAIEGDLAGAQACFFCLGVSSAGMSEQRYSRVTYDYTMAAAYALTRLNPDMTFIYVSGAGTDPSEQGRIMWARVKGRTENALLKLPLRAFMFRPGLIRPLHGIRSKTRLYQALYTAARPALGLVGRLWPDAVTSTEQLGRAMIRVAAGGYPRRILETRDINAAA